MSLVDWSLDEQDKARLLNPKQLASMLQVSLRTLWRMRSAKQLPNPLRIGGAIRWRREDIQQWIDAGCPQAPAKPR